MGGSELIIKLPPPGTVIRDLTITAINMMEKFGGVSVVQKGDQVSVSHPNLKSALTSFSSEVAYIYNVKRRGVVTWPRLHVNDKGTLKKVIPQNILTGMETYGDVAEYYVKKLPQLLGTGEVLEVLMGEGSQGRKKAKLKEIAITLGRGDIAMFQLFKVELYEGGLALNQPYTVDVKVRFDERWASLLLSGLILSYIGMVIGRGRSPEISLLTIPEVVYDPCHRDSWLAVNLASTLHRVPTNPTIPYILYIYATSILLEDPSSRKTLLTEFPEGLEFLNRAFSEKCRVRWDTGVLFRIHRIASYGTTFTEISREDLMIGGGVAKLADLCIEGDCTCLLQVRGLIERGLGAREPKILNAVTVLYEALIGSKDPAEASYYITRVVKDLEDRVFISRRCLVRLLEVLTGIKIVSRR